TKTKSWIKKYFWEGQQLADTATKISPDAPWYIRHRRLLAMAIPAVVFHIGWWSYMISQNAFGIFAEQYGSVPRWYMSITMLFGSMIAGATSEGGASVAFPVMTLAFGIKPAIARDFSFMIQSCGMVAAGFTILAMRVQVEYHSLLYCSLGGFVGMVLGLEYVAPSLTPPESKMYFVVIWFAFAFSLYQLNRLYGRRVYGMVPRWEEGVLFQLGPLAFNWKAATLFCFGVLGGIFSGMAGSGIDICSFACLTLLFRVSEKVATPTSVVLMAGNTVIGFLWRHFAQGGVEPEAWRFLAVCVPIVVLGAPFGSVIGSHFHRLVLAAFVYITDTVQLIGALAIVQPWTSKKTDAPLHLCLSSLAIVLAGMVFFKLLAWAGQRQLDKFEALEGAS
ncbi:unnamed protein product, partial [Heterosigma akashiwo]